MRPFLLLLRGKRWRRQMCRIGQRQTPSSPSVGHRSASFFRRNFDFVATAQPPATTKEVQFRPLNRLVDKIRNCLSDKRRSFFAHPHIKQPVISLLPCSMRLHDCYIIKLTCQRLCPGLLLSQWAVVAGVNREEGSQAASRGLAAWLI